MEFYLDGTTLLGTVTSSPYNLNWTPSTSLAEGSHTLTAKAYDPGGNVGTSSAVSVNVKYVNITAPADGSSVVKQTTVTIAADATTTVISVKFYVNGSLKSTDTTRPFSYAWTVPNTTGTQYTLQAKGYNGTTLIGISQVVVTSAASLLKTRLVK